MGFITLIRITALALVVWFAWRFISKRRLENKRKAKEDNKPLDAAMVKCHICNTHVPKSDALQHDGQWYCSKAHRDQSHN